MIECPTDEFVPLPIAAASAKLNYKEVRSHASAACAAATLLQFEGYEDKPSDPEFVQAVAQSAMRRVAQGIDVPAKEIAVVTSTPEGAIYVDSLLTAFDMEVVKDAKRLRNYVTNRLVVESDNNDPRIRMRALELLGKISDVGLFTERSEVTINNRSTVELETALRDKLRKLMGKDTAEDAKIAYATPPIDMPVQEITRPSEMLAGF